MLHLFKDILLFKGVNMFSWVQKNIKLSILIVLAVITGVGYYFYNSFFSTKQAPMPTIEVTALKTAFQKIYPTTSFVAKIESKDKVDLRARVQGFLQERLFQEGDIVKKNQPLFLIEKVNFEAAVREAQANVAKADAQVKNTQAQFERTQKLYKTKDVSQSRLDIAQADFASAQAELGRAQAGLDLAQKDLEYTTIVSPMDGKIGESVYSVGELIGPASGKLAQVVAIDPINAVFSISENQLLHLRKMFKDTQSVSVEFVLSDGQKYAHAGSINFIDVTLDEAMNTLKIKADFPNPKARLLSGQYGRVLIHAKEPVSVIKLPMKAVQQDMTGDFVYVVNQDNKIERKDITRGDELEDFSVVISEGLEPDELVVTEGFQKISVGMPVKVQLNN